MKHIGIVACSAEGAGLCYRTIIHESGKRCGEYVHPEVSMSSLSFAEYMKHIDADDWQSVAEMMANSAGKLRSIGAEFCISPDNTIHQSYDQAVALSGLPWLHIAEVVADEASGRGFKKVGLTGTKYLMEGPVYPPKINGRGIDCVIPAPDERRKINSYIFSELVNGVFSNECEDFFIKVIDGLMEKGCDAVILGCTEIPLIINEDNSPLPVLDSTRLLAKAAVEYALE